MFTEKGKKTGQTKRLLNYGPTIKKMMRGGGGDFLAARFFLLHQIFAISGGIFFLQQLLCTNFFILITVCKHNGSSVVHEQAYRNNDCKACLRLVAFSAF